MRIIRNNKKLGENKDRNEHKKITKDELRDALKKLKTGKVPGYDKITGKMLRDMCSMGDEVLLQICNKA